jgi:hypothetical protein
MLNMNKMMIVIFSFLIYPLISGVAQEKISEVLIISTIHGAHKVNPTYSYDSLFKFIEKFNPDIIGVEIREEDIDSSFTYLKNNYPYEMYECIKNYPSKNVLGFDWLGTELKGKAIPENYWKNSSAIKKLQKKLNTDSTILQKLSILDIIKEEKNKLAMKASLLELNDGRYDLINHIYYEQLKALLQDTDFIALSDFYQQRDEHIAQNILEIIRNNKGKQMIFLIGADHRDYTLKKVSNELGNQILLNHFNKSAGFKIEQKE